MTEFYNNRSQIDKLLYMIHVKFVLFYDESYKSYSLYVTKYKFLYILYIYTLSYMPVILFPDK